LVIIGMLNFQLKRVTKTVSKYVGTGQIYETCYGIGFRVVVNDSLLTRVAKTGLLKSRNGSQFNFFLGEGIHSVVIEF